MVDPDVGRGGDCLAKELVQRCCVVLSWGVLCVLRRACLYQPMRTENRQKSTNQRPGNSRVIASSAWLKLSYWLGGGESKTRLSLYNTIHKNATTKLGREAIINHGNVVRKAGKLSALIGQLGTVHICDVKWIYEPYFLIFQGISNVNYTRTWSIFN